MRELFWFGAFGFIQDTATTSAKKTVSKFLKDATKVFENAACSSGKF